MSEERRPRRMPIYETGSDHDDRTTSDRDDRTTHDDDIYEGKSSHKLFWTLIILALIAVFLGLAYFFGWTNQWSKGLNSLIPGVNFDWMNNPRIVAAETEEAPAAQQETVPTSAPVITPTPPVEPTAPPAREPTAPPTQVPTAAPTATPTPVAEAHATYTQGKEIKVKVNGKDETFRTFTYSGGYIPTDDPWFAPEKDKETKESYGRPIYGKTPQELTYNWLRELCKSPHQIIRLRTQMGMISPKSLKEEDELAFALAAKPAAEYDKIVNETLQFFFKKLKGGRIEQEPDWDLENYMLAVEHSDDSGEVNLHGRLNHDDDTKPEDKDILLTFYAKGAKETFVSSERGFLNTVNDAKAKSSKFSQRAWVNMTEGGTWKWKGKGGGGTVNPTPTPSDNTPTPAPTSTPTQGPTSTPTSAPTNTPRPTKDPSQRPTESDAPVGGGPTNPENSEDPHTTDHVESTPAPAATATPAPTAAPTAVPTAAVRPTEQCATAAPTPIREDQNTPPPGDDHHNVPTEKPAGTADDSFDPDSI